MSRPTDSTKVALVAIPAIIAALATGGGVALKASIDRRVEARRTIREDRQRFFDALMRAAAEAFAMCDIMVRKVDSNPKLHFGSPEMYEESVRFRAAFATLHVLGDEQLLSAANELNDLFDHRDDDGRVAYSRLERALRNTVRDNLDIDRTLWLSAHELQGPPTEPTSTED